MPFETTAPLALQVHPSSAVLDRRANRRASSDAIALIMGLVVMSTSLVLPLGVAGVIVCACVLGLAGLGIGTQPVRSAMAAHAVRRARWDRRDARERKLAAGSVAHHALVELTRLVEDIELRDPELAQRADLEALLDRFVALTVAHDQASNAARLSDRAQLERTRDACLADPEANPRRLELCERRLRCLDECEAKARRFNDELAIVADTVRLVAQQVACPEDLPPDDTIDRQLSELDDNAAARRQLAAELQGTPPAARGPRQSQT